MALYRDHVLPCLTHLTMSNRRLIEYRRRVVSQARVVSGNRDRVRPQFPLPNIAPRRRDRNPAVHVQPSPGKQRALFGDRPRNDCERRQRNLGWKEIKLRLRSIRYSESEVLEKRESNLRPTQGIVTAHTRAFNQDGV